MSYRLGIAVASDAVRLIELRDGHVRWAAESPIDDGNPLEVALEKLFIAAKVGAWPRPRATLAVGPSAAQLRRITGLPPLADAQLLARVVAEGAGRFFLRNGIPLATTGVQITEPGTVWAGAIDRPVVEAVHGVCRRRKIPLDRAFPTAAIVGRGLEGEHVVWHDGDVATELSHRDGFLVESRRVMTGHERSTDPPRARLVLDGLGDDGWRYADAYGAATTDSRDTMSFRIGATTPDGTVPRWRLAIAAGALIVAAVAAILAPGIAASRQASAAARTLATLAPARAAAIGAESDLRQVTSALSEVGAFDSSRISATLFLAAMSDALAPPTFVVAVRTDTAGGSIVALTPRAVTVLNQLERVPGIASPEIVGPVTRESTGGAERERMTVRYRWARVGSASAGKRK